MKLSKIWTTPLAFGFFVVMAITGILMFFHLQMGVNKLAHQWLGWAMIIAILAHAVTHWTSFKRYFEFQSIGFKIIFISIIVFILSCFNYTNNQKNTSSIKPILESLIKAPISNLAIIANKSTEKLLFELKQEGIDLQSPDSKLIEIVKGDKKLQKKALSIIFSNNN